MVHCRRSASPVVLAAAALIVVAVLNLSCGGGSPSSSTSVTTLAPTPRPSGSGSPSASSCRLGQGSANTDCERTTSRLLPQMEAAMELLVQNKPQIFDLQDETQPGTRAYRILDHGAYMDGLVANLQAAGLCAQRDLDDAAQQQIFVKESNDYSEEFDVVLSSGYMRRGNGAYRSTCTPAAFPVDRPTDAPPLGSGCYQPFPPHLYTMNCKEHVKGVDYTEMDSTPIVADVLYCAAIGYTDGRGQCPLRMEGAVDRVACENWRAGTAKDNGRPGPTWTNSKGEYCTGPESGCMNHPDSQYKLRVYKTGDYTVCAQEGRCCTRTIER